MDSLSGIQRYMLLIDTNKPASQEIVKDVAQKLESKDVTLIEVVQSLSEYINDEDLATRSKPVQYLSEIIKALSPTFLSRQQVLVLCQFFCDRIEDGGAVTGLQRLQTSGRFNRDMAAMTFRAVIEHFNDLKVRLQPQRLQVLELLHALMSGHREALKAMKNESLVAIVDIVAGEKDPRNLMIVFSMLKVIIFEWDISDHAEMLFDSAFCYFPITFRPPPNDPYGISAQDLKSRLRDCIAASGYFAPFAFPQLLDKIDSTSLNVKRDVLQTISSCASSYDCTSISNYSITIWDSLKYEVLNVQEEELEEEVFGVLQAVAAKLSQGSTTTRQTTPLAQYLRPILKECNELLEEPQQKQAKPAGKILYSISKSSAIALFLVSNAVFPSSITVYESSDTILKKTALLEVFAGICNSACVVERNWEGSEIPTEVQNPLGQYKDRLYEFASSALMGSSAQEISFRVAAVKLLFRLCSLRHCLQESEVGLIIKYFCELVLSEDPDGRDDLKNEAVQALVGVSKIRPNLVQDISIPELISRLPDSSVGSNDDYLIVLEGIAQLSVEETIAQTLARRLLNKLELVLKQDSSPTYPRALLTSLFYILSRQTDFQQTSLDLFYEKIVIGFVRQAVLASRGGAPTTALNEESSMEALGRLANLIVRKSDIEKQQHVGSQIYSLFADGSGLKSLSITQKSPKEQRTTMVLSTWLMAAIGSNVSTPLDKVWKEPTCSCVQLQIPFEHSENVPHLLKQLLELASTEAIPVIRQGILRQIALIVNKFLRHTETQYATDILGNINESLLKTEALEENSVRVLFWISKALILRLAKTEEVLEQLLSLLSNNRLGLAIGRGFGILLAPDELLSKANGAIIRLLANQKVFNYCIPRFAKSIRQAEGSAKRNYLIALSGILKYMGTDILMSDVDTLLPLLLQSLDLDTSEVKSATIETLIVIGQQSTQAIEGHISSVVNRLLDSIVHNDINDLKVRLNALRCLRLFPTKIKDSALLPLRAKVINRLMTGLDDPKRNVRKEAVECKAAWARLDEPDDD